eukprot:scaffold97804_cov20-Tisochrysis_lutea.AAC.1
MTFPISIKKKEVHWPLGGSAGTSAKSCAVLRLAHHCVLPSFVPNVHEQLSVPHDFLALICGTLLPHSDKASNWDAFQASLGSKPAVFKEWPGMSMEQQQRQSPGKELRAVEDALPISKDGPPFQAETSSEPFMPLPPSLFQGAALTLIEESPWHNNVQGIDQQSRNRSGSGAVRVRTPSISHPLRADWSGCSSSNLPAVYGSGPGLPAPPPNVPRMVSRSKGQHPHGSQGYQPAFGRTASAWMRQDSTSLGLAEQQQPGSAPSLHTHTHNKE